MKISINWLKEYLETNSQPEEISEILTNLGLEVEKGCHGPQAQAHGGGQSEKGRALIARREAIIEL